MVPINESRFLANMRPSSGEILPINQDLSASRAAAVDNLSRLQCLARVILGYIPPNTRSKLKSRENVVIPLFRSHATCER